MFGEWGIWFIGISSLIITWVTFPFFIKRMHSRGIVGKDMNKPNSPPVAEMGGTIVLLGFVFSIMMALFMNSHFGFFSGIDLLALLAAMLTIVLMGLLGIVDDIIGWKKGIRQYQHALIPIFAALPIMVLPQTIGNTGVDVPFVGFVHFGILYSILLVPFAITGASNAVNMLAGLNGLEAGMSLLNALALLVVGLIIGEQEVVILMIGLIGAIIPFLVLNWYPAKVFPGDSFTLMIGAGLAAASIVGNIEKVGLMLFGLYFFELVLKLRTKMQAESFGKIQPDGTLRAPEKIGSLTHVVMRMGNFTEKQVVLIILGMQLVVIAITLAVFWINYVTSTSAISYLGLAS
ncbi:MAG: UDP-N-acetylglucosamine--dolichyl-phosphate N-acetylglucosaminephosphotransferase [Candidatus Diapherotrites archaeon]|uniref:UDP-N-acetylglucosamine--dolichyl-phosphate N-acetylglucosaminephosphotransferase n=1 Tax=Candidatus Iainarchaeum sp. TaxID=3101447 RepID=A0A8T4C6G3_9ARCH|nr:UDP-N-acetylglucosamine--dolichyl-phosphate N-acetylglucosaminephosphotransferase [Candidatus Diapherotrites archaeon]